MKKLNRYSEEFIEENYKDMIIFNFMDTSYIPVSKTKSILADEFNATMKENGVEHIWCELGEFGPFIYIKNNGGLDDHVAIYGVDEFKKDAEGDWSQWMTLIGEYFNKVEIPAEPEAPIDL